MYINDLMNKTAVQFGTSGVRGLATAMTDWVCYAYTFAFLRAIQTNRVFPEQQMIGIAGDFRPSTKRIITACARAISDFGYSSVNLGNIPTPAVLFYGMAHKIPTLMVTGSHIPDDRNGIKFHLPTGEILKADEEQIRCQNIEQPSNLFASNGFFHTAQTEILPEPNLDAQDIYIARYLDFFPHDCLQDLSIGVYGHSSVAREILVTILIKLGAKISRLGYSDIFIPVDTEALRAEDKLLAKEWAAAGQFAALVSTDGDGDRPLISDECGNWLRGDVLGIVCAKQLGAKIVVTPVSSNTAVEKCGWFDQVIRTKIGSPYVISGMQQALINEKNAVVGYEANGGFLLGSDIKQEGRFLSALPTRDALIVIITVLTMIKAQQQTLASLINQLPARYTYSDRLKDIATDRTQTWLQKITTGNFVQDQQIIESYFGNLFGTVNDLNITDGLRITWDNGEIIHFRPSGNAPELRIYTEADTPERAFEINQFCLQNVTQLI